ncbi:unnamed protein product [Closterium sp. NIES-53]
MGANQWSLVRNGAKAVLNTKTVSELSEALPRRPNTPPCRARKPSTTYSAASTRRTSITATTCTTNAATTSPTTWTTSAATTSTTTTTNTATTLSPPPTSLAMFPH